ncbi:MAG: hypothetical protein FWD73_09795 [Polyangiaceae bacterium]|nr:hypothetical protein [Polyangiaceae bacterium]
MKHPILSGACAAGVAFATSLCASEAMAAACVGDADSPTGNPVYLAGSSAAKPILKELSAVLAPLNVRIIYQSVSSCTGLGEVTESTPDKTAGIYWDNGTELTCDVDTNGVVPDIGISDVYAPTCDTVTIHDGQKDFLGPIQIMTFVVPSSSKENSISAEAARVVYGVGGGATGSLVVTPWNTQGLIFQRPTTSGTRRMIGKAINLNVNSWNGTEKSGSGDVLTAVQGASASTPDAAIGILAADLADTSRATVKILAFQPQGQSCAYYPDSTSQSLDKANVRSGVYPIWGPLHLVTKVDGTGQPANDDVKTVINYLTMSSTAIDAPAKKTMIDTAVAAHTIPWCAMNVQRTGEVSANDQTTAYSAPEPCGCYYESKATGAASSSCKTCTADTDCGSGKCRYNYCEAR